MASRWNGRGRKQDYKQLLRDDPSGMSMLDQALEGATAEEKARVRGVLLRFGIDTDHEFYVIFVAIGQLLVLVEEAPENWRSLFDDVHQELKQWSRENFKSLESIKQHAMTSAELIAVLRRLLDSMQRSQSWSQETAQGLSNLRLKLSSIDSGLSDLASSSRDSHQKLGQIEAILGVSKVQLDKLMKQSNQSEDSLSLIVSQLSQFSENDSRRRIREWILSCSLAVLGLVAISQSFNNRAMRQQLADQEQRLRGQQETVDWIFRKANRAECVYGIKPPDDPQCRQYF